MSSEVRNWQVVFYEDDHGRVPVMEFVGSLSVREQAKVYSGLRLLAAYGVGLGMPHARHVEGRLWELRPGGVRLFYFVYVERQVVVLHGYLKKTDKAPRREIEIALRRMERLLEEER